jgi:glycosyltransferase involved in cell wall biosynthesis
VRILFLDQYSELGGAQQTLLDTVDAVQQNGWGVHVLLPGQGALVEELRYRRVPVSEIPSGPYNSGTKSFADSIRFALDLRQQVRVISDAMARADADLLYVNGPRLLPAASLAAKDAVPVVFHLHNHLRGSALRVTRWSIRRSGATVIGCSDSVLDPVRSCGTQKVQVIPNGVRDAGYRVRAFDRAGAWRIGMVGRVAPEKGQMEFVDAVGILHREFPEARFVICGSSLFSDRHGYDKAVRLRARGLPVGFIGWQNDISHVLDELDLLVVPSLQEGMGRIIVEAFSAGVPVIAFPAGGIPEVIRNGESGFLTTLFTAEALAEQIRGAMGADPAILRQVARSARRIWERTYTIAVYQKRITRLLEPLLPVSQAARETEMLPQRT